MSKHEEKIKEGVQPYLQSDEKVLAAIVAQPRGTTQAMAGVTMVGIAQQRAADAAADQAQLVLDAPMGLVVTDSRLLTLKMGTAMGLGVGGDVKDLLSAVPLTTVDSIAVKSLLLGKRVILTVRGNEIKLECNAKANAKGLAEAFTSARATAA